jgi:hypothetical protein
MDFFPLQFLNLALSSRGGGGVDGYVWGHNTFGASDGDRFFNGPRLFHVQSKSRKSGALPPLPLTS